MKILRYHCRAKGGEDWNFSSVDFQAFNLLVGDTATGKTRLLNTIFNIGAFVASDMYRTGFWDLTLEQAGATYRWVMETDDLGNDENSRILNEDLVRLGPGQEVNLIHRTPGEFLFKGSPLPKLAPRLTSISLLKEEPDIAPLHEGFSNIRRRKFFDDALSKISELEAVPPDLLSRMEKQPTTKNLYNTKLGLNATLFIISRYFSALYGQVRDNFRAAFPFVEEADLRDLRQVAPHLSIAVDIPVFCIRERGSAKWIPIMEISSGMQKVLLILTDTFVLPDDSIYIIDEYENSLGISAIDFFPTFVLSLEKPIQFFVTSHHPYIINNVPPRNWYIFHRHGTEVSVKYGDELEARFGKSRQQAFIQLINDPFYVRGVE